METLSEISNEKNYLIDKVLTSILAILGMCLCVFGIHNLVYAALQPGAFSGICFSCLGLSVALTYSDEVKVFVLGNLLPKSFISLLYEKSLIQLLTQPACSPEVCSIVALSPLLEADEIQEMIHALPNEYDIIRERGLVHLLPSPLRRMLDGSRISDRLLLSTRNADDPLTSLSSRNQHHNPHIIAGSSSIDVRNRSRWRTATRTNNFQQENSQSFFVPPNRDRLNETTTDQTNVTSSRQQRLLYMLIELAGKRITKFLTYQRKRMFENLQFVLSGGNIPDNILYVTSALTTITAIAYKYFWKDEYFRKRISSTFPMNLLQSLKGEKIAWNQVARISGPAISFTAKASSCILIIRWLSQILGKQTRSERLETMALTLPPEREDTSSRTNTPPPVLLLPSQIRETVREKNYGIIALESLSRIKSLASRNIYTLAMSLTCLLAWRIRTRFKATKTSFFWLYKIILNHISKKVPIVPRIDF